MRIRREFELAIDSPRADAPSNPLDTASAVPLDWTDPVEHRRKLAEAIRDVSRYVRGLPSYAGVYRSLQGSPQTNNVTTDWAPLVGFTEIRPSVPKKATADFTNGELTFFETGVYDVAASVSYAGKINRFYDWGARINGVDPVGPAVRQEVTTNSGNMLVTFVTKLSVMEAPSVFVLVVKSEIATTLDFEVGGWAIDRIDYNSPEMVNQVLFA